MAYQRVKESGLICGICTRSQTMSFITQATKLIDPTAIP
jgi:hypothetical protein